MLFRAIFWIALVALLMPREPDLGYGRPHASLPLPNEAANWLSAEMKAHSDLCSDHRSACSAGANLVSSLQGLALRSLGEVKVEIEASQHQRLVGTHSN